MSDDALTAWLESGCKVVLAEDEAAARRHQAFSLRFCEALTPAEDLGPTEESHQAAVAERVFAVHLDLNAHGEEEYSAVWRTLPASTRAALKTYIRMRSQHANQ